MYKTRTLSSIKSIFPPIHQPLPLSKPDSQKLLKAITSSFRAHLDKEHGPPAGLPPSPLSYLAETPSRPTDRHLGAVLNNPLFRDDRNAPESPTGTGLEPEEVFERAVAKGLMTVPRAHGFLLRVKHKLAAPSVGEDMAKPGPGLMVVQWLRASGIERSYSFLENWRFTNILVKFMAAEGLDELAWSWLQTLLDTRPVPPGATTTASWLKMSKTLLHSLVMAKTSAVELDGAYSAVVRGDALFQKHMPSSDLAWTAWMLVAHWTTNGSSLHTVPSVKLFDSFLAVGEHLPSHELESAHLDLYHPTNPSPTRAVNYILDEKHWGPKLPQNFDSPDSQKAREFTRFSSLLNDLGLDTALHLIKAGELELARTVLGRINTILPLFKNGGRPNTQWT